MRRNVICGGLKFVTGALLQVVSPLRAGDLPFLGRFQKSTARRNAALPGAKNFTVLLYCLKFLSAVRINLLSPVTIFQKRPLDDPGGKNSPETKTVRFAAVL